MPDIRSPYAPVRYRGVPWWEVARDLARGGFVTPEGMIHANLYNMINQGYMRPEMARMIEHLRSTGAEEAIGPTLAMMADAPEWIVLAAQFDQCGREIFDLTEGLVAAFNETDLGNTTLEDWHTPYPAFFLRFGKQPHLKLNFDGLGEDTQFEYLEGAFVAVSRVDGPFEGIRIRMGMTSVKEDGSGLLGFGHFLDFHPQTHAMPIEDAIDAALQMRNARIDSEPTPDESVNAIDLYRKERYADTAELLREGARLVFNSLFYIESLAASPERAPGRDVPQALVEKWESVVGHKREKLRSKLTADGYTVVRLLGRDFKEDEEEPSPPTGATVRTHWRRAHWRQQACGEGMKQRKRVRIPKVLVNRDQLEDELPGRIYKVGKPE